MGEGIFGFSSGKGTGEGEGLSFKIIAAFKNEFVHVLGFIRLLH